ncbi:MAG: hypothetical protein K6F05_06970 [Succinivibrio sp.]|nr:hypothetical protein [Succinivibrio sp.]
MNFEFLSSKFVIGLACGIVVGAVGYKMVSEQKLNPKELTSTIKNIANKFKTVNPLQGNVQGQGKGKGQGRGSSGSRSGRQSRAKA